MRVSIFLPKSVKRHHPYLVHRLRNRNRTRDHRARVMTTPALVPARVCTFCRRSMSRDMVEPTSQKDGMCDHCRDLWHSIREEGRPKVGWLMLLILCAIFWTAIIVGISIAARGQ